MSVIFGHLRAKYLQMKSIVKTIVFITSFILLISLFVYQNSGNPFIRIKNESDYKFDHVVVDFCGQIEKYDTISSKSETEYREIKKAYAYASIKVQIEDDIFELHATDYVGESRLPRGRYSYILMLNPDEINQNPLSLRVHPYKRNHIDAISITVKNFYNRYFGKRLGYI